MAVTLAQAALLSQDELQKGVLETFVIESPILDRIPLMEIEGNSFAYDEEATLPGVEFRAVNRFDFNQMLSNGDELILFRTQNIERGSIGLVDQLRNLFVNPESRLRAD